MRIWILNHYACPPDRPAGTRHYDLGKVFVERGNDVTIFASGFNHLSRREERVPPGHNMITSEVAGVRFVWLRTTPYTRNNYRRVLNMIQYALRVLVAQRREPAPDVVIGSSVHLLAVLAGYAIARLRRARFVFEVRDLWPQTLVDLGALSERGLPARLLRGLELFLYRRADLVVCLLPRASEYLLGRGISLDKVVYIPNGATVVAPGDLPVSEDTALLLKTMEDLRGRGIKIVGYTGAHGTANDVEVLVDAATWLRDRGADHLAVFLIGDGPTKAECQRRARQRGLGNVFFADPVPRVEVPAVLAALDLAVCTLRPSPVHRYGLSMNKLFDYLASGRPTVFAGDVADNPIHLAGAGMTVPARAPDQLAGALLALAALPAAHRNDLGERGRRYLREHHDPLRLADRFLAALAGIVDQ